MKAIGIIINDEGEKTEVLASDAAAASSTGDGGEPRASEDSTAAAAGERTDSAIANNTIEALSNLKTDIHDII